jgi:hypothetical protein
MIEVPYINGMNIGLGYNSITNGALPASALININEIRPVAEATGQQVSFHVDILSNTLSLAEQLGMSASASLSYGINTGGSAKASLVKTFKQNSYSVYVLVKVHVQNQQTLLDLTQAKLSDKNALLFATEPNQFNQQFGDSFVYGLINGGDFFGILEIESKSAEEYRSIKASLSGKAMFGVMSGSGSASFQETIEKLSSSYNMRATVIRDGGEGQLQTVNIDQLVKDAIDFPARVLDGKGVPFSALIVPYEHIPHPNRKVEPEINPTCFEDLSKTYNKLSRIESDLQHALENQEAFPGLVVDKTQERLEEVRGEIKKIVNAARNFYINPTKCDIPVINQVVFQVILPPQIAPSKLGRYWFIEMDNQLTIWERKEESTFFKTYPNEDPFQTIRMYEIGNEIYIQLSKYRLPFGPYEITTLKGAFSEDGKSANGTVLGNDSRVWKAKIEENVSL